MPELKPLDPGSDSTCDERLGQDYCSKPSAKWPASTSCGIPEYQPQVRGNIPVDFNNSTLEEALDYLRVITKSLLEAALAEHHLHHEGQPQQAARLRRAGGQDLLPVQRQHAAGTSGNRQRRPLGGRHPALLPVQLAERHHCQGQADQVALAEKILHDLDKPKSEVVVDIMVMEASSVYSRQLTAALAPTGLNVPINFTPRGGLQVVTNPTTTPTTTTDANGNPVTTTPTTAAPPAASIPLSNLGRLSTADFATTLPSALLQAVLSDANTKVLQSPQLRAVDNVKATLKIGDRQPTATGSFQPGIGGVGINPLVNTQFTFIDVGVNVELTPRVHDNGDVSHARRSGYLERHGHVNLGGIDQPIIGQRKISHDIRMHEGEVNLLGGLPNSRRPRQMTGIPGLASIPILRQLFTGESVDRQRQELMIALIPHIVRRPESPPRTCAASPSATSTIVHLNYGRQAG